MANLRDIKNRINSVKSTRQITNAMKMVAASKLRKAQEKIIKARPFADYVMDMITTLKYKNENYSHPLLEDTPENTKKLLVIMTSDRGLSGSFNFNIIRSAQDYLEDNPQAEVICIGKKGLDYFKKREWTLIKSYTDLFNEMDFSVSKEIANNIMNVFLEKNYGKIDVVYNEFKSAIQQNVIIKQILPIVPIEDENVRKLDFLYEPDKDIIIDELANKFINVEIWRILLESSAAEQGARMTAMDSATDNATELIEGLTLHYNRARQTRITTEIIEISSGAEAINN